MNRIILLIAAACVCTAAPRRGLAEDVRYFEKDGITYRETRHVIRRPIAETRVEPREYTVYREKFTTDVKQVERQYQSPVTEYQWTPVWQRSWNPFTPPTLVYKMMPQTRWEPRTETVRIPITNRELIPEKRTQQVPVVTQRIAEDEIVQRVAVGPAGSSPAASSPAGTKPAGSDPFANSSVGSRYGVGGVSKLENDPPRDGWRPADPVRR